MQRIVASDLWYDPLLLTSQFRILVLALPLPFLVYLLASSAVILSSEVLARDPHGLMVDMMIMHPWSTVFHHDGAVAALYARISLFTSSNSVWLWSWSRGS